MEESAMSKTRAVLLKKEPKLKLTWLVLNRPDKLNSFNEDLARDLQSGLLEVEEDKGTRVLIITGAGDKAFSAGADISAFTAGVTPMRAQYLSAKGHELFSIVQRLPQPVIAAINGYAFGGGCELAMVCDFRLAAKRAKIGLTEVGLGLLPGWGGTQLMPRIIGLAKAKEAIMFAKRFTADEALQIGLVHRVFADETFEEDVRTFAKTLAEQSPISLNLVKQCMNYGTQAPLEAGLLFESQAFGKLFSTQDLFEGIAAFLQKRKAEYKGE
jgi:enoyl-CoA hydratase/3-hydroxyacyl-CoA dehydrogenase